MSCYISNMIEENKNKTLFMGGTCNGSNWRDELVDRLKAANVAIDCYNPVVEDWTVECQAEEIRQRETCDYCLYYITPKMTGVYSIAEVVDDSNKRPMKTIFCVDNFDTDFEGQTINFTSHQLKSLQQTAKMVSDNGGVSVFGIDSLVNWIRLLDLANKAAI